MMQFGEDVVLTGSLILDRDTRITHQKIVRVCVQCAGRT